MRLTLYRVHNSHPVHAVRGMLDHKDLPYETVELRAGPHAADFQIGARMWSLPSFVPPGWLPASAGAGTTPP